MTDYQSVLETPDLGPGHTREVRIGDRPVLVLNLGQRYYALDGRCPDTGTPLELDLGAPGGRLVCPDHDTAYDIRTGESLDEGTGSLRRYDVRIDGNAIKVGPPLP